MIIIKTNNENKDYLVIGKRDIAILLLNGKNIPENIKKIVGNIYSETLNYEKEKAKYISEICIKKDSVIGNYLTNTKDIEVIKTAKKIHYDDVVNALNIAIYENNPIYEQIIPLFRKKIFGERSELAKEYSEEVIEYILNNTNFKEYLKKAEENNDFISKEYFTYENNCICLKKIKENKK